MEVLLTLFASLMLFLLVLSVVGWRENVWSLFMVLACLFLTVIAGAAVVSWRRGTLDVKSRHQKR
ncbi:hypothetical protein [Kocuria turfanensis]|uniref:hypothetical protein n=1 Tax=Kocuria turfanensis TaxID=388357 RepID=UPI0007882ABD|nr:hypothetical protein [Kocuria turfanensis]